MCEKKIYLIFEYMQADLSQVIRAKVLEPIHVQYVVFQLLKALAYLQRNGVMHLEIKSSNVMVNSDCHVRLIDFGNARLVDPENEALLDYCSRWHRAPEIVSVYNEII